MSNDKPILAYVAGRYSADTRAMRELNIRAAQHCGMILKEKGYFVICPHMNTAHDEDYLPEIPKEFYLDGDLVLLPICQLLVMVQGWTGSDGADGEWAEAHSLGIPVYESVDDVPYACDFKGKDVV